MLKRIGILVVCMIAMLSVALPVYAEDDFGNEGSETADLVWYNDLQFDKSTGTIVGNRIREEIDTLEIPSEIEGIPVTAIGYRAFKWSGMHNVSIPDTVTEIGDRAFEMTTCLKTVRFSEGLQKIGKYAFSDCEYISRIELPDSLTYIDDWAFSGCIELTRVELSHNLIHIGAWAFSGCEWIQEDFVLPDSLQSVGEFAFSGITPIDPIRISANLTSIGEGAFACKMLRGIEVADGNPVYIAENGMLFNKDKTVLLACAENWEDTYEIPSTVTRIGGGAFAYHNFGEITIPDQITYIGASAFRYCEKLKKVTLSENIETIREFAFANTAITEITIPESITGIGDGAFSECTDLCKVYFNAKNCGIMGKSDAFDDIGVPVFRNCTALTEIVIGEHVQRIADYAFRGCLSLSYIKIPSSVSRIGYHIFEPEAKKPMVYVEKDSYAQQYAEKNNIRFVVLEPDRILPSVSTQRVGYSEVIVQVDFNCGTVADKTVIAALYSENGLYFGGACLPINQEQTGASGIVAFDKESFPAMRPRYVKVFIWESGGMQPVGYVNSSPIIYW